MIAASAPSAGARLLADIGGTNARFALSAGAGLPLRELGRVPTGAFSSPEAAIRAMLAAHPAEPVTEAALAVAGPVLGDTVSLSNHPWSWSVAQLRHALGLRRLRVLNDFTALALAVPDLPPAALRAVGGGAPRPGQAVAVLGPGTGLGVSGLVPSGTGWVPLEGEGGHVTLPATTAREAAVLARLAHRFGHVSAERVLSGPGLGLLYDTLAALDGEAPDPALAGDIAALSDAGIRNRNAHAREALDLFCAWLGTVAGNLALTLGARGGVYLGGGILPRWGDYLMRSPFRARFEAHGRFAPYLAAIPVWLIETPGSPALAGAAQALDWGVGGIESAI